MLEDDVWLRNARAANAAAARLAEAAGARAMHPVEANELFLKLAPEAVAGLRARGFDFYDWGADGSGEIRLVTAWDTPAADVEALAAALSQ
jgi:threonine aldolase